MPVDTQKASEPYVDYEFFTVKCGDCDEESSAILYKNFGSCDGEGLVAYIKESVSYEVNRDKGGLRCKMCDRKNRVKRSREDGQKGDV